MFFQTSIGLDIRPDRIAVVCLKKNFKGVRLTQHSIFHLNSENSYGDRLEGFSEWFQAFLKENHSAGHGMPEIFLAFPRELVVIKRIQLPLAAKENLLSTVRFDLEKHVPLPEEEVCFDCHILSEDKAENRLHVLLIISKKKDVMMYLTHLERIGSIAGIDLPGAGLINFLHFHQRQELSEKETADLFKKRNGAEHSVDISGTGLTSADFVPAFGLALKGLTHVPVNLNLIPPSLRKKPSRLAIYTMMVLLLLMVLSLSALGGSYFIRKKMALKRLDTHLANFSEQISELDQIRKRVQELENRLSYLDSVQGDGISILDILLELTRMIPDSAWIQSLSYSDKGIQLDGYAETATNLISLLEGSPLFRNVVFLSSIIKDPNGGEKFRIGFEIKE